MTPRTRIRRAARALFAARRAQAAFDRDNRCAGCGAHIADPCAPDCKRDTRDML